MKFPKASYVYIKYVYDALGVQMQKEATDYQDASKIYTRKYVYDGDNVLFEYARNNPEVLV